MADTTPAPTNADALRQALELCSAELFAQCADQPRAMQYVEQARAALATAAQPPAGFVLVPIELAQRVQETMGEFLMDHGWRQQDMDTSDEFDAALAAAAPASAAKEQA